MNSKAQLKLILALIGFLLLLAPVLLLLSGFILSESSRSPTGNVVALDPQKDSSFSKLMNCSSPYVEVIDAPESLSDEGKGVFHVEVCNYNERENLAPLLSAYVSNFKQELSTPLPACTAIKTVSAGSYVAYDCNISLYSDCFGSFNLHFSTYKADVASDVNELVQAYPLLTKDAASFCAKKPYNARVSDLVFNQDVNNPTITATIQNRFTQNSLSYAISATKNGCENPDAQTGACLFCQDIENFEENTNKKVDCRLKKTSNGVAYPYSIVSQPGNISATVSFVDASATDENEPDNLLVKDTFYAFEFINVSIVPDSLHIVNSPTMYIATYSFDIANNGDLAKDVSYTLTAKTIDHLTDSTPQDLLLCSGTKNIAAGETTSISCSLQNLNGIDYTAVSCDQEDGCDYASDMVTTRAQISVEAQEADVYKQFETLESTQNLFAVPIYQELSVRAFETPTRGGA